MIPVPRSAALVAIAAACFAASAPLAAAAPEGWHGSLEKGLDAARRSGKPLLVVTAWGNGT